MKKRIEVVAALIKNGDKYLCCQRKDYGELAKKWEFPGGKIESGETPQEALIREINEELDMIVSINDHFVTVEHEYLGFVINLSVYNAQSNSLDHVLKEHLDAKWLTPCQMLEFDFAEADKPVINKLLKI